MSLSVDSSPVHSSSSDDFATFLDVELDTMSDASVDHEEEQEEEEEVEEEGGNTDDEFDYDSDLERVNKRRKVELPEALIDPQTSGSQGEPSQIVAGKIVISCISSSPEKNLCKHPGAIKGMCISCGQKLDDESGVAFAYIHKNLRLANDEIARLRAKDFDNLLRRKKLYLILDLDHTLLNSAHLFDITEEEGYLNGPRDDLPNTLKGSLFQLEHIRMMTKLRPFVQNFLKEAHNYFEMYIYTMGERPYALQMAQLLDPDGIYFNSRVIAKGDCTQAHQKGLDVILGQENAVLILDDTEKVWSKHKENLILMDRYHFFASSCKSFGLNDCRSLSQQKSDESETNGALATVLKILKRIHSLFFEDKLVNRDVRKILKTVREDVLKGCKIVFSRVFPNNFPAEHHQLWKMAEQLGAICSKEIDSSVTHVVSMDAGTDKSRWAVQENKHLVHPRWIEASNYLWENQTEENFRVTEAKNK